ncbi:GAF domain-containing protein [Polynucleobacter sp. MWH-UH25E]|uniref:GAF domain-containing protein n=1 Tax=Polynucleobacter sp. MWH-UH25E TaxID=1855616 RepID=UPI001BFE24F1|nr:GAF domain-containing protein [Polynucleobacter sp. MWH-UH25E]QWD61777.1 GAF domain-containing protein [Polynucleobacter sp. MWH-UH25E]
MIVSMDDLIFSSSEIGSRAILSKHLKDLVTLGFIELHQSEDDSSIEIPSPTAETIKYYQDLAQYLEKCFETNPSSNDPAALLVGSDILSHDYLKAQSHALSAYTLAVEQIDSKKSIPILARDICSAITNQERYVCACVGFAKIDSHAMIEIVASEGKAKEYGKNLLLSWDPKSDYGTGPTGVAIRSGKTVAISDIDMAINFGPWIEKAKEFGIRSTVSVPLFIDKKPIGILILYSDQPNSFGPVKIHLFEKLGAQLVAAIHR